VAALYAQPRTSASSSGAVRWHPGSRIQLCNGISRWRAGKELHGPQRRQVISALLLCRAEKRGGVSVGVRRRVTRPILKDYVSLRLTKAKRLGIGIALLDQDVLFH